MICCHNLLFQKIKREICCTAYSKTLDTIWLSEENTVSSDEAWLFQYGPKMKCWNPPWKMSQTQRQRKLEVKIHAQNHTNVHFCIRVLSIRMFIQQSTKFWNNYCIISISEDRILSYTRSFWMMPTFMFMYNVLQESNFLPKTIRLTNAGTYNITHWYGRMWLSTSLKLKRISLPESYFEFHEDTQSNVITVLKPLAEHDSQRCCYTW